MVGPFGIVGRVQLRVLPLPLGYSSTGYTSTGYTSTGYTLYPRLHPHHCE
jgi:hypothetical protein